MTLTFKKIRVWPAKVTTSRTKPRPKAKVPFDATIAELVTRLRELDTTWAYVGLGLTREEMRLDGWPRAGATPSFPGAFLIAECRYGTLLIVCDASSHWLTNLRVLATTLDHLRKIEASGVIDGQALYDPFLRSGLADWLADSPFAGDLGSPRIPSTWKDKRTTPPKRQATSRSSKSARPSSPPPKSPPPKSPPPKSPPPKSPPPKSPPPKSPPPKSPPPPPPSAPSSSGPKETFTTRVEAATWLAAKTESDATAILADRTAMMKAYRKAARTLHPDAGGDAADFRRLQNAKEAIERGSGWVK